MIYGFKPNEILNLISPLKILFLVINIRIEARDTIAFININIKRFCDKRHYFIYLKISDYAYIKLYKGYKIFTIYILDRKLF